MTQRRTFTPSAQGLDFQSLLLITMSALILLTTTLSGVWLARNRTREINEELQTRGVVLAQILASQAELGVLVGNREGLQQLISGLSRDPDVVWSVVRDQDGSALAEGPAQRPATLLQALETRHKGLSSDGKLPPFEPGQDWRTWLMQEGPERWRVVETNISTPQQAQSAEELALGVAPDKETTASTEVIGRVQLVFSLRRVDEAIAGLWQQIGLVMLLVWLLGLVLTVPITRRVVRPLEQLANTSRQIATGQLDVQLPASTLRELSALSGAFEHMVQGLLERDKTLAENADELTRQAEALQRGQDELREANQALLQLNQTLRFKQEQLHATNLELLKASDLKSAFLASMSHELRTPLNSIIGYSECLIDELDGPINSEQKDSLERVLRNGRHLLELINQVLDLSRIEAGRMELQLGSLDPVGFAEECLGLVQPLVRGRPLQLRLEAGSAGDGQQKPVRLEADGSRLRQVLLNLLSNAVYYTDQGEVVLSVEIQGDGVVFAVRDTGRGIPQDRQEEIFTPFRRLENSPGNGAGLGLAITRRLIDAMGGTIALESQPGRGSTFSVWLPFSPIGASTEGREMPRPLS